MHVMVAWDVGGGTDVPAVVVPLETLQTTAPKRRGIPVPGHRTCE